MLFLSLLKLVDNNGPAAITMNMGVEDAVFEPADGGDWPPLHEAHGEESCSQAHGTVSHGT